jgi:hypothetical protein
MKKILVIAPILAEWSESRFIEDSLSFLKPFYKLDLIDPLNGLDSSITIEKFFEDWRKKIDALILEYDGFVGFSFGGSILQNSFDLLEKGKKALVLLSTPTFADPLIFERLNTVINLIENDSVASGIKQLNEYVFYPHEIPNYTDELSNNPQTSLRLTKGFKLILGIDSRYTLNKTNLSYLHLIGEKSQLVNINNITVSPSCQLHIVPNAGMRVLQNNLNYCSTLILKFLEGQLA